MVPRRVWGLVFRLLVLGGGILLVRLPTIGCGIRVLTGMWRVMGRLGDQRRPLLWPAEYRRESVQSQYADDGKQQRFVRTVCSMFVRHASRMPFYRFLRVRKPGGA